MSRLKDLSGKEFGSLLVISRSDNDKYGRSRWNVECQVCKYKTTIDSTNLLSNKDKIKFGTGCRLCYESIKSSGKITKHGYSKTRLYGVYYRIVFRTTNPKCKEYKWYGGEGKTLCPKWETFLGFLEDILDLYPEAEELLEKGYQIDRINNDLGYFKENIRFATRKENCRNRRNTIKVDDPKNPGNLINLLDLVDRDGSVVRYKTLVERIKYKKWDVVRALTEQLHSKGVNGMKTNWKGAENQLARILREFGIPAERKQTRNFNWAVSDFDVGVDGHDNLKFDSKYSKVRPFRHHGLLYTIKQKYCKGKEDIPILFTKNYKEHFGNISVEVKFFAMLLAYWLGVADKDTLWNIFTGATKPFSNEDAKED
jgi:hypothetical protein